MSRVLLLATLLAAPTALASPSPVEVLADQLASAIEKRDRSALSSLCTAKFLGKTDGGDQTCTVPLESEPKGDVIGVECPPAPSPPNESCEGIYEQATRKNFTFQVHQTDVSETHSDRAVVTYNVVVDNKPVDRVYLYGVQVDEQWRFDHIDEDERHVAAYLAGKAGATGD